MNREGSSSSLRPRPVAIVGGGYSGTVVAARLAREGISAFLIDGSGRMGLGHAYSTTEPTHLLNVRAERMSAFAEQPDHFADRFAEAGGDRRGFAQRAFYGLYLRSILEEAIGSGCTVALEANAVAACRGPDGWHIALSDGRNVQAGTLVLALGNQAPETLPAFAGVGPRFIADPWGAAPRDAVARVATDDLPVLLIGTGLTMVDAVLSLDAAGHSGRIVAVSRRGQLPLAHADFRPAPVALEDLPVGRLTEMWRWLRRRSGEVGWQAAVDSLRHHSQDIWQSWDTADQRRFLRHARPWWDVRRHRIAPEVAAVIERRIASRGLEIVAGRIGAVEPAGPELKVEIKPRGSGATRTETFALAINCTGPLHAITRTRNPLLRDLLDQGLVKADALGIGIAMGENARVAGADDLFAVGPLTKGRYWEITAVPDIREQAAAIADTIVERLSNDR